MTNTPDEDLARATPRIRTFAELVSYALGSWSRTLRLLAVLWALLTPLVGILALITISLKAVTKSNLGWTHYVALVVTSVFLTIASATLARILRRVIRREDAAESKLEVASELFVESMAGLEKAGTEAAALWLDEPPDIIPLGTILEALRDQGAWTSTDVADFLRLLQIRNGLVHGQASADIENLQEATMASRRLMDRLGRILD